MALIMEGKTPARLIRDALAARISRIGRTRAWTPCLATVQVGNDPAAGSYIRSQMKLCSELGITPRRYHLPPDVPAEEVLHLLKELSADDSVDAIILERPLPPGWVLPKMLDAIDPAKDAEGIHRQNLGSLYLGDGNISVPCTALAIMTLLRFYGFRDIRRWNASVLGVSPTVGKAVAMLLLQQKASVTLLHSQSEIAASLATADLVIVGIGSPRAITGDLIKPGAVVIDVGINVLGDGTIVGDVDAASILPSAKAITPVPGGIGPMTVAALAHNVLTCALRRRGEPVEDLTLDDLLSEEKRETLP